MELLLSSAASPGVCVAHDRAQFPRQPGLLACIGIDTAGLLAHPVPAAALSVNLSAPLFELERQSSLDPKNCTSVSVWGEH